MSEASQGDGWWQASDLKWYPPELDTRVSGSPPASRLRHERAGFGIRLVAFLLNAVIVGFPWLIVGAVVEGLLPTEIEPCRVDGEARLCETFTSTGNAVLLLVTLALSVGVLVGYYGYFDGVTGATPGRRIVGLRLVDALTGEPIGLGRAVGRELFKIISTLVLFLGFLSVLWDPDKRAWHDMVANSAVVKSPWRGQLDLQLDAPGATTRTKASASGPATHSPPSVSDEGPLDPHGGTCSAPNCDQPARHSGLCALHELRSRRG